MVNNNNLFFIKSNLEHKVIQKRIDFISDFEWSNHFDEETVKYIISFLKNFSFTKNNEYNWKAIELADIFQVEDIEVCEKLLSYLNMSTHYLVKLSVIDYVIYTHYFFSDVDFYTPLKKLIDSKTDRLIIKTQALLLIILIQKKIKKNQKKQLQQLLKKSNGYRCHIRAINFMKNELMDILSKSFILEIIEISKKKNLGRALNVSIAEFEKELN